MAISRGPRLVTNGLVLALDPSDDNSFAAQNLPIKNGLVLWLDAADDDSFVYSSGTSVSQWRDKSGNNRHFFQSTAGNQPSRSAVINSRKAIQFTAASSNYLRFNSTIINNRTGGSVFVIWRTTGETSQYSQILDNYHGGANAQYAGFSIERNSTNNQYYWGFQDTGFTPAGNIGSTAYSDNTTYCYWITKDSTTITGGYNGTSVTPVPSPSSTWTEDTKGWLIGSWGSNTETFSRFFNGQIAEIVIFNRGLSPTEVKQVNTYLGQKWGIVNTDRTIVDLSGNNNNGLLGNGTTADMPAFDAYNKGALKLDGTSDYIAVANATSLNPSTVTVSLWVKRNGYQSSVASYLRRNYNDAYAIIGDIAADNVRFRIHNGSTYPESPNATLSLNEWTNIVGTYDLNNIKIYKNGVFVNQTAHTSAISYSSANTVLTIGRDDPVAGRYMNANYGSVLIYNRALSAAEILQNYNAQKGKYLNTIVQQGLVLNLDAGNPYSYAGAGTVWYDVSGNSNNGTLTNGPTYNADVGGNIVFDGSNDYVAVTSAASIKNTSNLSLEGWVFISSAMNYYGGIIGKGISDSQEEYCLLVHSVNSKVYMDVGAGGGPYTDATFSFSLNTWYHIIGTHERIAGSSAIKIYVNGSLLSSSTISPTSAVNDNTTNVSIGSRYDGGNSVWNGKIATARIYTRTLSAAEVLQNYNATKGRFGL